MYFNKNKFNKNRTFNNRMNNRNYKSTLDTNCNYDFST